MFPQHAPSRNGGGAFMCAAPATLSSLSHFRRAGVTESAAILRRRRRRTDAILRLAAGRHRWRQWVMDNDDLPVGRILTRREVLAAFGVSAGVLLAGCAGARSESATATTVTAAATAPGRATQPTGPATRGAEAATAASSPVAASQVAAVGTAGTTSSATGCVVRPEMTEGPYFVDEKLNRSDIRTDPTDGTTKPGVPLALTFAVGQAGTNACSPLAGATVDVWHCDAQGVYSDVTDSAIGFNTVGKKFLRGSQVTDARGTATFTTIYPG